MENGPGMVLVDSLLPALSHHSSTPRNSVRSRNQAIEDIQDNAAHSQNEVMELTKKLAEQKVRKIITVQTDAGEDTRDDQGGPISPRYSEVCRDLAMSLSHKLNEKEQLIQDLEHQLEQKEAELERVSQMMVHLNARLKFYEILHNDGQPVSPKKLSSSAPPTTPTSPPNKSSPNTPNNKPSQTSRPESPASSMTSQRAIKQARQPSRPETPMKPPTTPRFNFRYALE